MSQPSLNGIFNLISGEEVKVVMLKKHIVSLVESFQQNCPSSEGDGQWYNESILSGELIP